MKPIPPTPSQLRALAIRDPALGHVMKSTPPFPSHPVGRYSHFHSLSRAVISQQLAGKAANAIYGRVKALVPGPAFPTPARFLELSDEELRGAGLSKAKTRAIRDLAGRVESGKLKLRSIGRQPDVEVIRRLTEVWGIGEWSAQMFLIFRLGRLDVMPAGDLGVQEGLRILDGLEERPKPERILERSEPWRPLRSVASWVLWQIVDTNLPG
jgi:3-methyladenine DNA glycosylase/8-oxoguanine DNA glycosylase